MRLKFFPVPTLVVVVVVNGAPVVNVGVTAEVIVAVVIVVVGDGAPVVKQ